VPPPPSTSVAPPLRSEKDAKQQKASRRHRGKTAEGEERDAMPDLLLKYPDTIFATYVYRPMKHLKHASETLAKILENT
jgi:hypothetical protein